MSAAESHAPAMDLHTSNGDFTLGAACLLIAIDETGHEELADERYPIFGLGGCVTIVDEYHSQVRRRWDSLKNRHFDGADRPLHAAGLQSTREGYEALGAFFRDQRFGRFAAITAMDTSLPGEMNRFQATALVMGQLLGEAAERYTFDQIAVVFEHSQRT